MRVPIIKFNAPASSGHVYLPESAAGCENWPAVDVYDRRSEDAPERSKLGMASGFRVEDGWLTVELDATASEFRSVVPMVVRPALMAYLRRRGTHESVNSAEDKQPTDEVDKVERIDYLYFTPADDCSWPGNV